MKALIQLSYWLLIILSCAGLSHLRQPITDMLSNFYLHFSLVGTILFFVALHWRLPRTALVSVAIATICFGLAFSYDRVSVVQQTQASDAPNGRFTIMTFNAWEQAKTMNRLIGFLKEAQPDFVILQEITLKDWRALKAVKSIYPYTSYCDDWLCGVAMLSKHKWNSVQARNFGPHKLPLITATFGPDLNGLTLMAVHSARPHWKYSTQREQFEHLADHLKSKPQSPILMAGDLNASVFSALLRDFAATSRLKSAGTFTVTWPQRLRQFGYFQLPFLQLDLDHFFVTPNLKIIHKRRGPDLGSDHRPLLLDFEF